MYIVKDSWTGYCSPLDGSGVGNVDANPLIALLLRQLKQF